MTWRDDLRMQVFNVLSERTTKVEFRRELVRLIEIIDATDGDEETRWLAEALRFGFEFKEAPIDMFGRVMSLFEKELNYRQVVARDMITGDFFIFHDYLYQFYGFLYRRENYLEVKLDALAVLRVAEFVNTDSTWRLCPEQLRERFDPDRIVQKCKPSIVVVP